SAALNPLGQRIPHIAGQKDAADDLAEIHVTEQWSVRAGAAVEYRKRVSRPGLELGHVPVKGFAAPGDIQILVGHLRTPRFQMAPVFPVERRARFGRASSRNR